MIAEILFYVLSFIVITGTVLPFFRKDHWTFRVCEFPRLQKLFLILIALALGIYCFRANTVVDVLLVVLLIDAGYMMYLILPFTVIGKKTLPTAKDASQNSIRLLICNVYQPNTGYDRLIKVMEKYSPDLIMLVETDQKWLEGLKEYTDRYPYKLEQPKDNTYGLLFYSKLEILEGEVRHLVKEDYPSLKLKLKLPGGKECLFYGLHPPPPSPTEKTYSTARDSELVKAAHEVDPNIPTIVAGDLNDVAWSYTTDRFIEISGLKDPRKGRGIYSTFHAKNLLMRWPLDHIFCSSHFGLVKLKRCQKVGSDHFPVFVELSLDDLSRQR